MGLAQRVVCLDRGRIIAAGSPAAIRRDPAVVAAYLGMAPEEPA
jgi:ABC-type branched-subunit amino acid transport system ATPase component